jgi:hypothetical protein
MDALSNSPATIVPENKDFMIAPAAVDVSRPSHDESVGSGVLTIDRSQAQWLIALMKLFS